MVFKKIPASERRTLIYKVRVRPQFKEVAEKKLEWLRKQKGYEDATITDLIRLALNEYLKEPGDPREP